MLGMKDLEVDPGTDVAALALSSVSPLSFVGQFAARSFQCISIFFQFCSGTVVKIARVSQNVQNCEKPALVKITLLASTRLALLQRWVFFEGRNSGVGALSQCPIERSKMFPFLFITLP